MVLVASAASNVPHSPPKDQVPKAIAETSRSVLPNRARRIRNHLLSQAWHKELLRSASVRRRIVLEHSGPYLRVETLRMDPVAEHLRCLQHVTGWSALGPQFRTKPQARAVAQIHVPPRGGSAVGYGSTRS